MKRVNSFCEEKKYQRILPVETLQDKIKDATPIELEESITLQLQREMEETLFSNTGVYRAWQFKDGDINPLSIHSTLIDLKNNYNEPTRVRRGFKTEGKVVTVPNYFFQIDGTDHEYAAFVSSCLQAKNTLVLTDRGESLLGYSVRDDEKLKLVFCQLNDSTFYLPELKKLSFYQWDKYRDSLEDFMLNAINRLFSDSMFKTPLTQQMQFDIVTDILSMNHNIIKMVDNFDFTDKIPKILIFLENEEFISDRVLYLLGYIHELGFDIIIFNPSGLMSIDTVISTAKYSTERLETMNYTCTLESIKKESSKAKNWFKRHFM
jgi:hypothetical protein